MELIFSNENAKYYLVDLEYVKEFQDVDLFFDDDLIERISNVFKNEIRELQRIHGTLAVYHQLIEYKNELFVIFGVPMQGANPSPNDIYSCMISDDMYAILGAYIEEKCFFRGDAVLFRGCEIDEMCKVASILYRDISLSFLFRKSKEYFLICGISHWVNRANFKLRLHRAMEYLPVRYISPVFVLHCLEHEEEYTGIFMVSAVWKLKCFYTFETNKIT